MRWPPSTLHLVLYDFITVCCILLMYLKQINQSTNPHESCDYISLYYGTIKICLNQDLVSNDMKVFFQARMNNV